MDPPVPAANAFATRFATLVGMAVTEARGRRRWTTRELASRARVSAASVSNVEAGRRASLDVYSRLATALGLSFDVVSADRQRRRSREQRDIVHAAMGELEAGLLGPLGYRVAIDHPYQHYQFAGRADVLAWSLEPAVLLHIENRTRFPDLQAAAGSYNAKRSYLAATLADQLGIRRFTSQTHVIAGLWSSEVIHRVRVRRATFTALCPDDRSRFDAWLTGRPPTEGVSSSFLLLDPFARGRQERWAGLERVLGGVRPRVRGYREAAERLRSERRA